MHLAEPGCYLVYNLVAAKLCPCGKRPGSSYNRLFFLFRQALKTFRLGSNVGIVTEEFVDSRPQKSEPFFAVSENKFSGNKTLFSPSVYCLCRNIEVSGKGFYGVNFLALLIDGKSELAAQFGDENSQVVRKLFAFLGRLLRKSFLGMKTGNMKTDEIEGVFPAGFDQGQELFGGVELFSKVLLRRKAKLRKQLR
jgi:hypothetical protein